MSKSYYVVGESKTNKILGFNLTEAEKNELFYHIDKGDGHKGSEGRFYTATEFEVKDLDELELILGIRKRFKDSNNYSYVILTDTDKWVATGSNESEKLMLETIEDAKKSFPDEDKFIIFEVVGKGVSV